MATNRRYADVSTLRVVCTNPTTPASGDPVRWGNRIGVALTDEASDGYTTVQFRGAFDLSVKGIDGGGNSAVAAGDALFYVDGDTPKISKKSAGYFIGFADEAVGSGQTATIRVALADSPGSGALGSGTVGETQLASGAVTTAKISDANVTAAKLAPIPGLVYHTRARFSAAEVNAGDTIVAAPGAGWKLRLVDAALIAIGGNAATADSVDILGTASASGVKLMAGLVAGLTRSTLLRAGAATNGVILADGASFTALDEDTAITIGKTGSNLATATHIDALVSYQVQEA